MMMGILLLAASFAAGGDTPVSEKYRGHENVEWSISYAFGLTEPKEKDLPRVLIVGDSICNYCREDIRGFLKGKMNVSWWFSSYCVTSPEYLRILAFKLDEAKCAVVHFNNGLHSLWTPTEDYVAAYEQAIRLIRKKQPEARIIWMNSTPVLDDYKSAKVKELNAALGRMMKEKFPEIPLNDLNAVMSSAPEAEAFADTCHPKPEMAKKMGSSCMTVGVRSLHNLI